MTRILDDAEVLVRLPEFRWSLERYHAAIEAGVLTDNDKVELLFGKLVPISPIGIGHAKNVSLINDCLVRKLDKKDYYLGVQNPVTLVDDSEPEPDLFVAKGGINTYDHHPYPADLLLVIEVSDSTLHRDRTAKKLSYALAGIEEYWIINVYEKQIERYTLPKAEEGIYESKEIFKRGDNFTSLHLGDFAVDDLTLKVV